MMNDEGGKNSLFPNNHQMTKPKIQALKEIYSFLVFVFVCAMFDFFFNFSLMFRLEMIFNLSLALK